MSRFTFLYFSLLSILMSCLNNYVLSSKNEPVVSEIILNDMESAFKSVTNATNTLIRKKIIPELYNLTSIPSFSFKIPNDESELGYSMISMERSEMMKPIFPNISLNQEEIILKNEYLKSSVRKVEPSEKNAEANADVWSILGLEGWSGEITDATDLLKIEHKDKLVSSKDKYSTSSEMDKALYETESEISKDNPMVQDFYLTKSTTNVTNTTFADISENVYIARANDPFGFSTKWIFRNQTTNATNDDRSKRALVELYSMIKCATGCEPLTYQSYGCFCGFLGNGNAVDGIDSCCRMHDKCYEQSNCISYLQYFVPYIWKCYRGKPLCALSHGEFGGPASCAAILCYCDMRLAICLRKYTCPKCKAICRTSLARKLQNIFF